MDEVNCRGYNSSKTWDAVSPRAEKKSWSSSVWFKGSIPKHAFNMWVAQLNRLPTRARLASWGILNNTDCCLCGREDETRDHSLYFHPIGLAHDPSKTKPVSAVVSVLVRTPLMD